MVENTIIKESFNMLRNMLLERNVPLERIVLFGSYATGEFRNDSDIDYIVVSPLFRNKSIFEKFNITKGIKYSLVSEFQMPFDIFYYSDIEWESGKAIPISEAKKNGIVFYKM